MEHLNANNMAKEKLSRFSVAFLAQRERECVSDRTLECKKGQDGSSHGFPLHFMHRERVLERERECVR